VWLYHVFSLSLRDVELMLAERGVVVSYETVQRWCRKFAGSFAAAGHDPATSGTWMRVCRERTTSNGRAELHRR
jgi:transposase-like protein